MIAVKRVCPNCKKEFYISSKMLNAKYKNGYVPVFCNIKCELRFSERMS
ncbi:MAG: hypothetical protein K6E79_02145 [Pseudobutyrivibrio sp.]|nr:hypothetical protein [Pseudobutyrivibrio sp.]